MPSKIVPIIKAISPPRRYSGKVVTIRCTSAVDAITAMFVWNINEFNQVLPYTIGWIFMNGRD